MSSRVPDIFVKVMAFRDQTGWSTGCVLRLVLDFIDANGHDLVALPSFLQGYAEFVIASSPSPAATRQSMKIISGMQRAARRRR